MNPLKNQDTNLLRILSHYGCLLKKFLFLIIIICVGFPKGKQYGICC
jgi:hypothetical protein